MSKDEQSFRKSLTMNTIPKIFSRGLLRQVTKQMEQMEKADVLKKEVLLNTRKNTKNEKRAVLACPFSKAAPNIFITIRKH